MVTFRREVEIKSDGEVKMYDYVYGGVSDIQSWRWEALNLLAVYIDISLSILSKKLREYEEMFLESPPSL